MLTYIKIDSDVFTSLEKPADVVTFISLMYKRNTRTNLTHPLTFRQLSALAKISLRECYRCVERIKQKGFIVQVTQKNGKYVWEITT